MTAKRLYIETAIVSIMVSALIFTAYYFILK